MKFDPLNGIVPAGPATTGGTGVWDAINPYSEANQAEKHNDKLIEELEKKKEEEAQGSADPEPDDPSQPTPEPEPRARA